MDGELLDSVRGHGIGEGLHPCHLQKFVGGPHPCYNCLVNSIFVAIATSIEIVVFVFLHCRRCVGRRGCRYLSLVGFLLRSCPFLMTLRSKPSIDLS